MRRGRLVWSLVFSIGLGLGLLVLTIVQDIKPQLGLDLQGGISVVLEPRTKVPETVLDQAIEIIRSRVDALGVAEPEISRQGSSVIVQLPGVKDRERALDLIGTTAQLYFRPVIEPLPATESATTPTTTPEAAPPAEPAGCAANKTPSIDTSGTTSADQDVPEKQVVLPQKDSDGTVTARYLLGPACVNGQALSTARASVDTSNGTWEVLFELSSDGNRQWNEMARAVGQGNSIAIDLDGVVKSAPRLDTTDFPGKGRITGNFSEREAKDLALVLRYGALPVQLDRQTVDTVSASLGKESLRAGIVAGLVGLVLVILYMILYYRALGIVVLLGLILTGCYMYAIVSLLGQRGLALTLAGATGIIVSVGVTVDSYVVYFERLKDEIRSGKTVRSSVDRTFSRAYRTIIAADAASFIGAVVLYWLSVGSVRGFAFFLGLSTLLDVFLAYFFTRPMVVLLGRKRLFTEARWLGVARGLAAPRTDETLVKTPA